MLIGLSGYGRSGKDSVGSLLVQDHGFTRIAFADILRDAMLALNPHVPYVGVLDAREMPYAPVKSPAPEFFRLADLVKWYGWEHLKTSAPETRGLLQRLGTEVGRNLISEDVWVTAALKGVGSNDNVVVTDCRFVNEARTVTDRGGIVVRVSRPGVGPANEHISEVGLDNWQFDHYIANDGSISDLSDDVDELVKYWKRQADIDSLLDGIHLEASPRVSA